MDTKDQSPIKILICKNNILDLPKYYIVAFEKGEAIGLSFRYIKRDGELDAWGSDDDYMDSYEECLQAININYEILEEVETPKGWTSYAANEM